HATPTRLPRVQPASKPPSASPESLKQLCPFETRLTRPVKVSPISAARIARAPKGPRPAGRRLEPPLALWANSFPLALRRHPSRGEAQPAPKARAQRRARAARRGTTVGDQPASQGDPGLHARSAPREPTRPSRLFDYGHRRHFCPRTSLPRRAGGRRSQKFAA